MKRTERKDREFYSFPEFEKSKGVVSNMVAIEERNKERRKYMEDRAFVEEIQNYEEKDNYLFGVLDGHGGSQVVDFCQEQIPQVK